MVDMNKLLDTAAYAAARTAPPLLAFALGPNASLRNWLAVKSLPAPLAPADDAALKRSNRLRVFAHVAVTVAVLGAEAYIFARGSMDVIDMFMRIVCAAVYQIALAALFAQLLQAFKFSVHRRPDGFIAMRILSTNKLKSVVAFLLATVVNVGAYYDVHSSLAVLVSVALLSRSIASLSVPKMSVRSVAIGLLIWLALTGVLSVIACVIIAKVLANNKRPTGHTDEDKVRAMMSDMDSGPSEGFKVISANVMRYANILMPYVWNLGPGILISIVYRFDYAQHLNKSGESAPVHETVIAPANKLDLTNGVVLPAWGPRRFRKPYTFTTTFSWFLAHVLVAAFFVVVDVPQDVLDTSAFSLMGLTLAIPIMVFNLFVVAYVRGDFRSMWQYTEHWRVKRDESAVATASDAEASGDESSVVVEHMSYSDEKDASLFEVVESVETAAPASESNAKL